MLWLKDKWGRQHKVRALLDSGSQMHLMTEKLVSQLQLLQHSTKISMQGVGDIKAETNKYVRTTMQSVHNNYEVDLTFFIVDNITSLLPHDNLKRTEINIPQNIGLTDKNFCVSSEIDILIDAEILLQLLCWSNFNCQYEFDYSKNIIGMDSRRKSDIPVQN